MKKLMYILVVLLATLSFSIKFINKNQNDINTLNEVSYGLVNKISDKENYRIIIENESLENNKRFLDELLKLCKSNKYILATSQLLNTDSSTIKKINYIYDRDNIILKYLNENYGYKVEAVSLENGYITTDINDTKASGYLKAISSIYLDGDVYEYTDFNNFISELSNVNNYIIYNIYNEDIKEVEKNIADIADGLINYTPLDSEEEYEEQIEYIQDIYIILIISVIALLICIINEFLKLKKEVGIVKLLGYSKKDIFYNFFFQFVLRIISIFVIVNIVLWMIFVGSFSKSGIIFIKDILSNSLLFVLVFIITVIGCYLMLVRNINIKKSVNYDILLKISFLFKNIITILLCIIVFYSFVDIWAIGNETSLLLAKKEIYDKYYRVENMADDPNAMKTLLKEKDTLACFFYSEGGAETELPYIIVNRNYLDLYLDEYKDVKSPALLVPEAYKGEILDQYKDGTDCEVFYLKKHHIYQNLISNNHDNIKDPIILLSDGTDGDIKYNYSNLLLSNNKEMSYYRNLVSDYIDADQIRLVNASDLINDTLSYYTIPTVVKLFLYMSIYLIVYSIIIYIYMKLYFSQKAKDLSLKKLLGYDFLRRYKEIYGINLIAYLLPFSINVFLLKNNILITLIVLMFMVFFEIIIESIMIMNFDKKTTVNLLKGSDE